MDTTDDGYPVTNAITGRDARLTFARYSFGAGWVVYESLFPGAETDYSATTNQMVTKHTGITSTRPQLTY